MKKKIDVYEDLTINDNNKKVSFDKFKKTFGLLYKELRQNKKEIDIYVNENNDLNSKINQIINGYLNIINIFLKLLSLFFIISYIVVVAAISNFNFLILLLFAIVTPLTSIFLNVYIKELLKERYKNRNYKIKFLKFLIQQNNCKIDELKLVSSKIVNDIIEISDNYYKQNGKIDLTQNIIKKTQNCCTNSFIKTNVIYNSENNHLIKIKKPKNNKTRKL